MDISYEPMDVDLSLNSIKNMDDSNCDSEEPLRSRPTSPFEVSKYIEAYIKQEPINENVTPVIESVDRSVSSLNVKKYHINIQRESKQKSNLILKFSVVMVLFASVVIYFVNNIQCSDEFNVPLLKEALKNHVYGQNKAIDLLVGSLQVKVSSKILFMFGGTGVGKTYAVSLILENVWNASNVYHYTMPMFLETFPNDLLIGMSFCKSSVLIVDDLTQYDMNIIEHIERIIQKSENLKKNITIILIYNLDNIESGFIKKSDAAFFELELRENFGHIDAFKEYIRFETLTEEHLEFCIRAELGSSNIENIEQIMKNFNVTHDGCKGVYTKIKLLNLL